MKQSPFKIGEEPNQNQPGSWRLCNFGRTYRLQFVFFVHFRAKRREITNSKIAYRNCQNYVCERFLTIGVTPKLTKFKIEANKDYNHDINQHRIKDYVEGNY